MKRLAALFLILLLVVPPLSASRADNPFPDAGQIFINGQQLTEANPYYHNDTTVDNDPYGASAYMNFDDSILTLDGLTVENSTATDGGIFIDVDSAHSSHTLTILLKSSNVVSMGSSTTFISSAVQSRCNLKIKGSGTLEAIGRPYSSTDQSIGISATNITVSGGTLIAFGNTRALSSPYESGTPTGNVTIGPAGVEKGIECRASDSASKESNWPGIVPTSAVYGDNAQTVSFLNRNVRISEVSAVSGTVKDAAGDPVNSFRLRFSGIFIPGSYSTVNDTYTAYLENGDYTLTANHTAQTDMVGTARFTVNGAPLTGQNIVLRSSTMPGVTVSPAATFFEGNAPDHLTLHIGSAGSPPNSAAHFCSLEISGDNTCFTTVDSGDYALRYGSIHIELSQGFLNSLTPGVYTLRANLAGAYTGIAPTAQLTVTAAGGVFDVPKTGDYATPALWIFLALLSCAGLAASAEMKRRAAKRR